MEFLTALFTIMLVMVGFKYRKSIGRWLNDPRSDVANYEIKILKKYGIDNAAQRVKELRHLEDEDTKSFQED